MIFLQKQIENDVSELYKPVNTQYVGNKDITMALDSLKTELHQARHDTIHMNIGCEGIEDIIKSEQEESSGDNDDEVIVLEDF